MGLLRIRLGSTVKRRLAKPNDSIQFNHDAAELAPAKDSGITVILTAYRRAKYLPDQIAALRAQTIPPEEIWV